MEKPEASFRKFFPLNTANTKKSPFNPVISILALLVIGVQLSVSSWLSSTGGVCRGVMLRSVIAAKLGAAVGWGFLCGFFFSPAVSVCLWEAGRVDFDDWMSPFQ